MSWLSTITGRMANDANRTFPQGVGPGFQTINRNPLIDGVLGVGSLPSGTTLPTGSTAGRAGVGAIGRIAPGATAAGGGLGALLAGLQGSGTGPQPPTPGFHPNIPTPGGAGMGSTGAPGTMPTNTNAPPQGLMAALAGLLGGGAGMSPGSQAPPPSSFMNAVSQIAGATPGATATPTGVLFPGATANNISPEMVQQMLRGAPGGGGGMLGGGNPLVNAGGMPGLAGGGGLATLLAALQNQNRGPGQQSHGTPT